MAVQEFPDKPFGDFDLAGVVSLSRRAQSRVAQRPPRLELVEQRRDVGFHVRMRGGPPIKAREIVKFVHAMIGCYSAMSAQNLSRSILPPETIATIGPAPALPVRA